MNNIIIWKKISLEERKTRTRKSFITRENNPYMDAREILFKTRK